MLVDTNIVSYLYRRDFRAKDYRQHLAGKPLYVSFMTVGELYKWPYERSWTELQRQKLVAFIQNFHVLPYDDALAWTWAKLVAQTCRGRPMSFEDSWIAATALRHGLPIVTHNRRHFDQVPGLTIISEAPDPA
jgi:tRNA(fMet)-specific endonuclease VapC